MRRGFPETTYKMTRPNPKIDIGQLNQREMELNFQKNIIWIGRMRKISSKKYGQVMGLKKNK